MSAKVDAEASLESGSERFFQPFCTMRYMSKDASQAKELRCNIEDEKATLTKQDAYPAILAKYHQATEDDFRPTLVHLYPEGSHRLTLLAAKDPWAAMAQLGPFPVEAELVDCRDERSKRPLRQWKGRVTVTPTQITSPITPSQASEGHKDDVAGMCETLDLPHTCKEVLKRTRGIKRYDIEFEGYDEDLAESDTGDSPTKGTWTATAFVPDDGSSPWYSYSAQGDCPYSSIMSVPLKSEGYHALLGARIASMPPEDTDGVEEDEGSLTTYPLPSGFTSVEDDPWRFMRVRLSAMRMQLLTSRIKYNLNHVLHGSSNIAEIPIRSITDGADSMTVLPKLAAFVLDPSISERDTRRPAPVWLHVQPTADRLPVDPPAVPVFSRSLTNIVSTWQDLAKAGEPYTVSASIICDGEGVVTKDIAELTVQTVRTFDMFKPGQSKVMRESLPFGTSSHIVNVLSATPRVSIFEITLRRQDQDKIWKTRIAVPGTPKNPCLAVSIASDKVPHKFASPGIASPLSWESGPNAYIVSTMAPNGKLESDSEGGLTDDENEGEKNSS